MQPRTPSRPSIWPGLLVIGLLSAPLATAGGSAAVEGLLDKSRAMMAGDDLSIRPGDWAAYRVTLAPGTDTGMVGLEMLVKISSPLHVDTAHPLGPDQYWLEFELSDPNPQSTSTFTLKILASGDPRETKAVQKMFIKGGNRPPLQITQRWIDKDSVQTLPCERCDAGGCQQIGGKVTKGVEKRIYTKLGWLAAQSFQIHLPENKGVREYWFSKQVPMFRIVRATIDERMKMELDGYGHGALSRIDETAAVPMPDPEKLEKEFSGQNP